jgi:hypothetical protein
MIFFIRVCDASMVVFRFMCDTSMVVSRFMVASLTPCSWSLIWLDLCTDLLLLLLLLPGMEHDGGVIPPVVQHAAGNLPLVQHGDVFPPVVQDAAVFPPVIQHAAAVLPAVQGAVMMDPAEEEVAISLLDLRNVKLDVQYVTSRSGRRCRPSCRLTDGYVE